MAFPHNNFGYDITNSQHPRQDQRQNPQQRISRPQNQSQPPTHHPTALFANPVENVDFGDSSMSSGVLGRSMHTDTLSNLRKNSMTNSSGILSPPADYIYDRQQEVHGLGIDTSDTLTSTAPFESCGNDIVHFGQPTTSTNANGYKSWAFVTSPADRTSLYDGLCSPVGNVAGYQFASDVVNGPHGVIFPSRQTEQRSVFIHPSQSQLLESSDSCDWTSMNAEDVTDRRARKRTNSMPRSIKQDGVRKDSRKRNTRIDIPPEHTLEALERIIEQTEDVEEVKELKSHRRLLRNREAALASRQRKKKHTEDLEVKEQHYVSRISMLEQESKGLRRHLENEMQQHQEALHTIDSLHLENEELVIKHTEESGVLRKQIEHLLGQVDTAASSVMSANRSSTGYADVTTNMDALTMSGALDDHFQDEQHGMAWDMSGQTLEQQQGLQELNASKPSTGVLFMILLCGALVTSRSASSSKPVIPRMPEEVQAASSTVLDSLLRDGHLANYGRPNPVSQLATAFEPSPSDVTGADSHMAAMHTQLTTASRAQQTAQAYHLTPAQVNAIMDPQISPDYLDYDQQLLPQRRRLEDIVRRFDKEGVVHSDQARVYTRSLLLNKVSPETVRQFTKLVREIERVNDPTTIYHGQGLFDQGQGHDTAMTFGYALDED